MTPRQEYLKCNLILTPLTLKPALAVEGPNLREGLGLLEKPIEAACVTAAESRLLDWLRTGKPCTP